VSLKQYFRTTEVARFFNVTKVTVIDWIKKGRLLAYETLGGHHRILREDLINLIKKKGIPTPDELKSLEELKADKYRILIVDDEKNIIESVKAMLEDIGIDLEIQTASDGFEAGIKAVRFLPHLIILDAIMPGADGDRLCILVREDEALKNTKILVFTGYPDEGKKYLELGADRVIEKSSPEANIEPFRNEVCKLLGIKYKKVIPQTKDVSYGV
jgi:excisionase family DNA binding protein